MGILASQRVLAAQGDDSIAYNTIIQSLEERAPYCQYNLPPYLTAASSENTKYVGSMGTGQYENNMKCMGTHVIFLPTAVVFFFL